MHCFIKNIKNKYHDDEKRLAFVDFKKELNFTLNKVIRMEAADNYTRIFCVGQRPYIISKVLKIYEEMLQPLGFVRIHRSHLVNREFIRCIQGDCVIMEDASVMEISKSKKSNVMKQLLNSADDKWLSLQGIKKEQNFTLNQVIRMEAADNYTRIFCIGQRPFTTSKVLKVYEEQLKPFGFLRTHRSHLVNKDFIRSVQSDSVIMQDASVIEISKSKKNYVIKQLLFPAQTG